MAGKTDAEVIIGGRVLTLSGYESEEYLQRIASYINGKLDEYNKDEGFRKQSVDLQNILLEINMADDYFKAKKQITELEDKVKEKEKEIYDLKHDLINYQVRLEGKGKKTVG
ncbi:MAG: cell division protein ZapA [Lachnospiraceae bacterium]|nr:cell division protein ZapA [Lachnospiraceae bacterium]